QPTKSAALPFAIAPHVPQARLDCCKMEVEGVGAVPVRTSSPSSLAKDGGIVWQR
ncbi:hypothetical protein TSMEX_006757, partial [Taenia solium]